MKIELYGDYRFCMLELEEQMCDDQQFSCCCLYTKAVQKLSRLVLLLQYERAPRDTACSERVLVCLELFALGALTLAFLSSCHSQYRKGVSV
jgi:hypothetical protein